MSDLNVNTFKARRAEIVKRMDKNSILLISSAKLVSRNNDTTFPFRQNSNFFYLSQDIASSLVPTHKNTQHKYTKKKSINKQTIILYDIRKRLKIHSIQSHVSTHHTTLCDCVHVRYNT